MASWRFFNTLKNKALPAFLVGSLCSFASFSMQAQAEEVSLSSIANGGSANDTTTGTPAAKSTNLKTPLLMEGKSTLYQRVLTTPSCKLFKDEKLSGNGEVVNTFTQYYVYEDLNDVYHVGSNSTGKLEGYISKSCVVPWKQQLALLFTNNANRERALIFDNEQSLDAIIDNKDGPEQYKKLLDEVVVGKHADHVISIEPREFVDYQKNFYLLPILNSVESIYPDGSYVWKHEIASITEDAAKSVTDSKGSSANTASAKAGSDSSGTPSLAAIAASGDDNSAQKGNGSYDPNEPAIVGFKSAVVFVIDSSISMQPYIDRTKQAINTIYKKISDANIEDSVQFGIVSFRGDSRAVPGLEYTTKMFLRPGEVTDAASFNKKVESLSQATVSSKQFDEDSYAGINMALSDIDWNKYGGRYIVLITDAGAIDSQDKESSTGFDANALRLEAEHQGAAIYTLHLLTPSGAKNHKQAQKQYEELSYNRVLDKPLYYGVSAGSVDAYGKMVDKLATSITAQVERAVEGKLSAGSSLAAREPAKKQETKEQKALEEDSIKLGLAMQLAYLGRVNNTKSPDFLRGWMADHDVDEHNKVVATPIVLVNRNQLSDLYTLVKGVLEAGIAGQLSSDDMFSQLQALAAQMGRDPNQLSKSKSISEQGIMGELLEDLPYKSRIASLTPDDWYNMGAQEQDNIIRSLEASLNYISRCSSDNDRFIKLNDKADESEEVYPIPLDALP